MKQMTFEEKFPALAEIERNPNISDIEKSTVSGMRRLHDAHPFFPIPNPVECLNLIMKREFAEEIIRGTKKIEWRSASEHYFERLYDKNTEEYLRNHIDDELLAEYYPEPVRQVKTIHFHNYNNSWGLDVTVNYTDIIRIDSNGIKTLHELYDNHEWDDIYESEKARGGKNYPLVFYFEIGEIIKRTNI